LKKFVLLHGVLVITSLILVSCGGGSGSGSSSAAKSSPSNVTERVFVSQSASTPTASGGLLIVNGFDDTLTRKGISAGTAPGLMAIDPGHTTVLAFDSITNKVEVVNTAKETNTGAVQLAGPTMSIVEPNSSVAFAAVPSTVLIGSSPGAVVEMNLTNGGITATIGVPGAQTVVSNPTGTQVLAFSNDSDSVTIVSPSLVSSGSPVTVNVPGFDRPVFAVYSSDGSTAYILNCGAQCGGTQASVQLMNFGTTPPSAGALVDVDAATVAYLSGTTLYVAGTSPSPANNACTGETTAAMICGRLDVVDLTSMTVTGRAVITNGYHDRIDLGQNGQLFIGSHTCTNVGNVNNPTGEVRGCLSIYNTANGSVVIPPDNGDVTGLQSFSERLVEYVAEGGYLRVYDTQTDTLLENTQYIPTGTIVITGIVTDIKSVDFF
jgi:hypothetical protein